MHEMLIGILSDTHDNIPKIKKAVDIFKANKVEFVLHAGDFIAPFAIVPLEGLGCEYLGVFGNNDGEKKGLALKSKARIKPGPLRIKKANRSILLSHEILPIDLRREKFDLVIFGHTHTPEIHLKDKTLFLNPGECGGWLTGKCTIAICRLSTLTCHILEI